MVKVACLKPLVFDHEFPLVVQVAIQKTQFLKKLPPTKTFIGILNHITYKGVIQQLRGQFTVWPQPI